MNLINRDLKPVQLDEKALYFVSRFEDKAVEIGDMDRAMKLNWLRNKMYQTELSYEDVIETCLEIWIEPEPTNIMEGK